MAGCASHLAAEKLRRIHEPLVFRGSCLRRIFRQLARVAGRPPRIDDVAAALTGDRWLAAPAISLPKNSVASTSRWSSEDRVWAGFFVSSPASRAGGLASPTLLQR